MGDRYSQYGHQQWYENNNYRPNPQMNTQPHQMNPQMAHPQNHPSQMPMNPHGQISHPGMTHGPVNHPPHPSHPSHGSHPGQHQSGAYGDYRYPGYTPYPYAYPHRPYEPLYEMHMPMMYPELYPNPSVSPMVPPPTLSNPSQNPSQNPVLNPEPRPQPVSVSEPPKITPVTVAPPPLPPSANPVPSPVVQAQGLQGVQVPGPRKASNKAKQRISELAVVPEPVSQETEDVELEEGEDDEDIASEVGIDSQREERHLGLLSRLDKLNRTFIENKDRIYVEKAASLETEITEMLRGSHPEYEESLNELEAEKDRLVKQAELYRDYQLNCSQSLYTLEQETCISEYKAEKAGLRDKMLQELEDKKRKLKEELNLTNSETLEQKSNARKATRQARPEERKEGGKRRKVASLAVLPFLLKEVEISEDIAFLRKNSNRSKTLKRR